MKARATRAAPLAEAAARLATARPSLSPELRGEAAEAARLGHDFARVAVPAGPPGSGGVIQRVTDEQRNAVKRLGKRPSTSDMGANMLWLGEVRKLHALLSREDSDEARTLAAEVGSWIGAPTPSQPTGSRSGGASTPSKPLSKPPSSTPPSLPSSRPIPSPTPSLSTSLSPSPSSSLAPRSTAPLSVPSFSSSPSPSSPSAPSPLSRPVTIPVNEPRSQTMTGTGGDSRWGGEHRWDSRFDVKVDPRKKHVRATIRLDTAASDPELTDWDQANAHKWNDRYALAMPHPSGRGTEQYPISVKLKRGTKKKPAHYRVEARKPTDPGFSASRGRKGTSSMTTWGTEDVEDVPHEVGHMLGNQDEYYTIDGHQYTGPGERARKGVDVDEGSIMNDPKNAPRARHYELIRRKVAEHLGQDVEVQERAPVEERRMVRAPTGSGPSMGMGGMDMGAMVKSLRPVPKKPPPVEEDSSSSPSSPYTPSPHFSTPFGMGMPRGTPLPVREPRERKGAPKDLDRDASPAPFDFRSVLRKAPPRPEAPSAVEEEAPSPTPLRKPTLGPPSTSARGGPVSTAEKLTRPLPKPTARPLPVPPSSTPVSSPTPEPEKPPPVTSPTSSAPGGGMATDEHREQIMTRLDNVGTFLAGQEDSEHRTDFQERLRAAREKIEAEFGRGGVTLERAKKIAAGFMNFGREVKGHYPDT